jgi:hypothetical protein
MARHIPRNLANRKTITKHLHQVFWSIEGQTQGPSRAIPAATASWLLSLDTQELKQIRTSHMKPTRWKNTADGHESQKALN